MEQFVQHKNQELDQFTRTVARCFGYYGVNVDDHNGIGATKMLVLMYQLKFLGDTKEYAYA